MRPIETLDEVVQAQKRGEARGIPSICSAHPHVLRTAMRRAASDGTLLIEATCNQVNQYGGYTGMTPAGFAAHLRDLAREAGLPIERLIVGGDHLGPFVWQSLPAQAAMHEAETLVRQCVQAGYVKLHLDASMRLADDDPTQPLEVEVASRRTAVLARVAEEAHATSPASGPLRYVIGTEVPAPGGSVERARRVEVTSVGAVRQTIEAARQAFRREGLETAWERVMAVVVQPGVEFGDDYVLDYDASAAAALSAFIETEPKLVYEAHSTDYQRPEALREMVRDHFAVLKVGPALTYAFREAVFALARIEDELLTGSSAELRSRIVQVLDQAMLHKPEHWVRHYRGAPEEVARARKSGLSDRSRYYWADDEVRRALERLIANLEVQPIPQALLSHFLPHAAKPVRAGEVADTPRGLLLDAVDGVLDAFTAACGSS